MALRLLWLSLTLLGALQTQAQDSAPNLIPAPPLARVPLQRNFRADQFQGKWYVVGLAGNAVSQTEDGQFTMYTTNYELKEDGSYNVTSTLLRRNENCDYFVRTFVRTSRPGQFRLGNIRGRTKELPQELKENFSRFAKSLGLADDNIVYPVPIDTCIDDE
ncbi:neutrophil gelatinase-associated lipocalin isoform X3 [Pipistrellus kuhlii]|uniref:neutrophil gelatinase-associated lipocalin isoform X3 n=1 Tax=Pipistrellus kuhlii TaxID=59472 RepID=UPI001E272407|nr:neutrophil gelatinase-associated lipocalin isoform X3 [Pipistrellus kuhlii]